jgi:hypothetical protein
VKNQHAQHDRDGSKIGIWVTSRRASWPANGDEWENGKKTAHRLLLQIEAKWRGKKLTPAEELSWGPAGFVDGEAKNEDKQRQEETEPTASDPNEP